MAVELDVAYTVPKDTVVTVCENVTAALDVTPTEDAVSPSALSAVPEAGVKVIADLPYKLDIEIWPEAIPARFLTAVSPSDIVAVDDRPSSTLTFASDIAPED